MPPGSSTIFGTCPIACPPLGKWNMSAHGEWRSYYNEEMKRAVARKFRHEICFFGYRFEGDASF
jgi:hypothetical protein